MHSMIHKRNTDDLGNYDSFPRTSFDGLDDDGEVGAENPEEDKDRRPQIISENHRSGTREKKPTGSRRNLAR